MNIIDFAEDQALLNLSLSLAQRTLLKSFYGEELSEDEIAIFRECVGREYEPRAYSELTCIAGARSGKDSRIATSIALFEAFCSDHRGRRKGPTLEYAQPTGQHLQNFN